MADAKIQGKRWDKVFEDEIVKKWRAENLYKFEENSDKPIYSIDTPPPYVNSPIHIGHASTYSLQDMFARFRRMIGYNVLFPLGLDRNGLPIEMAAEKRFKVSANDIPREDFVNMCLKVLEESSAESVDSFMKLGIGFNSWNLGDKPGSMYETDSDDYRALTQDTFIDLYKKGLIYEDERVNNYCPGCQTTIADSEIDYSDLPSQFTDVKWKVKETGEEIIIGTTRPEFLASCGMVIFHPDDERYQHLEGKTAIVPLYEIEVPIKGHPLADPDKGTGVAMMCSFGDYSDVRFFREQGLNPKILINIDGTMNELAGDFVKGMKIKDARAVVLDLLREKDLIISQRNVLHRTPICERSKDPIEFIAMSELYLKQVEFKDKMKELSGKLNFYEPKSEQILLNWIDTVSIDWPISRRRVYATEVPLWYCNKCEEIIVPPKGKYYKPWNEKPPVAKCPKCGSNDFRGDIRVFDTWFDSSITPLYILKWSRDNEFFNKAKPCTLRPQGKEIVRTWLYYTVLKDYLLTDELIFKDVWIHQHITDEKGYKMSKSIGNIIDPHDIMEQYGAEPFRLWCAVEGNLTKTDFKCSYERIEGAGKTLTKLWNVCRFISMFPEAEKPAKLEALDEWIISELNSLIEMANDGFMTYDFHNPVVKIKHFVWETFASHYLELAKKRVYNPEGNFSKEEQDSALWTCHYVVETMLKLLAPIIPIITYKIYMDLKERDIHFEKFPEVEHKLESAFSYDDISNLNSLIWKTKKDGGKSLKDEISKVVAPENLKVIEKDLVATHNIKEISFDKEFKVEL